MSVEVPIELIRPSPYQPRLHFDTEELKEEIKLDGLLSPLTVRKKDGYYELIDGERRLRALKELGWKKVPVNTMKLDNSLARLAVFKLNTIRAGYKTEELAKYFRKLHDSGMTFYKIAKELGIKNDHWVLAHINIFKFPEEIRNAIWVGAITVSHVMELEPLIGAGLIEESTKLLKEAWLRNLTTRQLRRVAQPRFEEVEKAKIEAAKEAIGPAGPISVKFETPEELEKAAEALKREAERRRTPEQKAEQKRREAIAQARKSLSAIKKKIDGAEKIIGVSVFRKRLNELEKSLVENPHEVRKQLIALGKGVTKAKKQHQMKIEEEKRRRREEEERRRIREEMKQKLEEEAKAKAKEELLKDREFIKEFIAKEYPFMRKTLGIEDLKEELMQRLITSVPEEKRERAEKIFEEEFRSLRKRLKMFPEKSARMEPKFDRLHQLEEEGVFLTTLWDIGERAGYAGRGDFHGNCPPQVVESCVLHKTKKGELVVDPMAGSGTALDVCKLLGRNCIAYDLKPPKWRNDIIRNDSRKIPLENNSADMVFLHPPYWDMVYYTSVNERLPDLSRAETLDEYLSMLGQVLQECYRILKSEKHLCILLGDRIKKGRFIPLCRKTANLAEEIGFTDCGYAIKFTKGSTSLVVKGKTIYAELAYTENLPKINHDLVMFFKKA